MLALDLIFGKPIEFKADKAQAQSFAIEAYEKGRVGRDKYVQSSRVGPHEMHVLKS
jgi:hypothetical protein